MRPRLSLCTFLALTLAACSSTASGGGGSSLPAACVNGLVSQRCTCGESVVTGGYCCSGVAQATACSSGAYCGDGTCGAGETGINCPSDCPLASGALIVDHNAVVAFDSIPSDWLAAAKALTLHYGSLSHGHQILAGLQALERRDARYNVTIGSDELPAVTTPASLRINHRWMEPENYWKGSTGQADTRAAASTGDYGFSMWSWCGQQSDNSTGDVQAYVTTLSQFESEYPAMRFILMTGHTDGSDTPTVPGTLKYNNELVRQYATAQGMVVFDFADIESYDPAGNYYPNADDRCLWCANWCSAHPSDCTDLPASETECDHSHGFNCVLKAKAFWWMMARLAGWDGT